MWEFLTAVLTSDKFLVILLGIIVLAVVATILSKAGILSIQTKHVRFGAETEDQVRERMIIKMQLEASHDFCLSLENKLSKMVETRMYDGYYAKCILEEIFDKTVLWIATNHIQNNEAYISCKQREIRNFLFTKEIPEVFKTPEFKERADRWVSELVDQLADIRELYSKKK